MPDIKISQLPEATSASGVFAQDAAGTNRTEQVTIDQIVAAIKPVLDTYYAPLTETQAALDGKANIGDSYTKAESDVKYRLYDAANFFLFHTASESLNVGINTYDSPGANVSAENLVDFSYNGSLTYTGVNPRMLILMSEISYECLTGNNTTTNFYWGKNWTSGPPSETNSIMLRETDTVDKAAVTCAWIIQLQQGDTLDLVLNTDKASSTVTILNGKYYGFLV